MSGKTFDKKLDGKRLSNQRKRVFEVMRDGVWRTLRELADITVDPEASVSARLRDFRKEKYGAHQTEYQTLSQ